MNLKDAKEGGVCIGLSQGMQQGHGNVTMELCCGSVCTRVLAVSLVFCVIPVCYYRLGHGGCSVRLWVKSWKDLSI